MVMLKEIIIIRGFGMKGVLWTVPESWVEGNEIHIPSELNKTLIKAVYKDSGKHELYMGKNRRVYELERIIKRD